VPYSTRSRANWVAASRRSGAGPDPSLTVWRPKVSGVRVDDDAVIRTRPRTPGSVDTMLHSIKCSPGRGPPNYWPCGTPAATHAETDEGVVRFRESAKLGGALRGPQVGL